jgi:class 3 adenylate cyclase
VLFCDIFGSTKRASVLDPEQLRELMGAYYKSCGEVISGYDGHLAQYKGDGPMVYFERPRAHEDDAAARRARCSGISPDFPLAMMSIGKSGLLLIMELTTRFIPRGGGRLELMTCSQN